MSSAKGAMWQASDIDSFVGHIKKMSGDHSGCRTLQQCLDIAPQKMIPIIYKEVGDSLTELMMDSFGNYLFQKLLDMSTVEQRREVVGRPVSALTLASQGQAHDRGGLARCARHALGAEAYSEVRASAGHAQGHHGRAARTHRRAELRLERQPRDPALSELHA